MTNIGNAITESIAFISNVGTECQLLADVVKQEISNLLADRTIDMQIQASDWISARRLDSRGWVYTDIACSLPLIIKPKRNIEAYLFFQISLFGDGLAAEASAETSTDTKRHPMVHIGLWGMPVDLKSSMMGFPLDTQDETPSLEDNFLFRWRDLAGKLNVWAYSLYLTEINTIEDIRSKIVSPVKTLLSNKSAAEALPKELKGLVHYGTVQNQPGHYVVIP